MLVSQRSTICLLILGLIVCPSLSKAEEGFLFRNQQKTTGSARYYSGVEPYALQAQLPTLPTRARRKRTGQGPGRRTGSCRTAGYHAGTGYAKTCHTSSRRAQGGCTGACHAQGCH